MTRSSRIPGFYKLSLAERRAKLASEIGVELAALVAPTLDEETANHMVENVVGVYGLPLGIALNFRVNGDDYLVPMCVEEPSVVAAASNAAKMVREGGGFNAEADEPIMIAQVQLDAVRDTLAATQAHRRPRRRDPPHGRRRLPVAGRARRRRRGIEVRTLKRSTAHEPGMLAVHLYVDCATRWAPTWSTPSPRRSRRASASSPTPTSACASCRTSPTGAACASAAACRRTA